MIHAHWLGIQLGLGLLLLIPRVQYQNRTRMLLYVAASSVRCPMPQRAAYFDKYITGNHTRTLSIVRDLGCQAKGTKKVAIVVL